ncbi:MAG: hypothetical protein HA490_02550 [Archaeoglobales archaeon]|nr:hypothetical protein [Archaeoglobales archaeon]
MFEVYYTQEMEPRKALEDIKKGMGFEPSLAIFFVAGKMEKPELLRLNCNSISVPVEGIITPNGVWSRGVLALVTDADASVRVFEGNAKDVVGMMERSRIGSFNLLIYPLFFVKDLLTFLRLRISFMRVNNIEEASEIFERVIYPMNTILRPFRNSEKIALAMNIFPLETGIGLPKIFFNGKTIGRSVICVSFKEKLECEFRDSFPERGKNFEETVEILSQELVNVKKVKVIKKALAIKEIDKKSVKDFLREYKIFMKRNLDEDLLQQKFFAASPYMICFISKETYGSCSLGTFDYELKFYPSLFDTDVFFDDAIFAGEFIHGGVRKLFEVVKKADFAIFDQNFMLMFEERVNELIEEINGYGIFTSYPSFSGEVEKRLMSEVENGICVNTTQTMVFLNFK